MRRLILPLVLILVAAAGVLFVRGDIPCAVLVTQPACEVALEPGPAEDTLAKVDIEGEDVYPSDGSLLLTTVAVRDELGLGSWIDARRSGVVDLVPRSTIYPEGSDPSEVAEVNAALMQDSQLVATTAALRELGYDLAGEGALVVGVTEDAVTDALRTGDLIVAVDATEVAESSDVVTAVQASGPGAEVVFTVRGEDGDLREAVVTLGASPDDPSVGYVGVLLTTELELPVEVTIDAGVIGGPSAGLMFALSIVELLSPEDLTGGHVIAGTGTVDMDGVVGAVGGIRQKVAGAAAPGEDQRPATVFLVPEGDLETARSAVVSSDLLLVPVATLDDALDALEDLRAGREPDGALALAAAG